jgi:hypothetical protein
MIMADALPDAVNHGDATSGISLVHVNRILCCASPTCLLESTDHDHHLYIHDG